MTPQNEEVGPMTDYDTTWLREQLKDAVGKASGRASTPETGVEDLITLIRLLEPFAREIDSIAQPGSVFGTQAMMMESIDPDRALGSVAKLRINTAHDLRLAGLIVAAGALHRGELQPPGGVKATAFTFPTKLPATCPGVAVFRDGTRSRTMVVAGLVDGGQVRNYFLPVLIEPATDPTNECSVALQSLEQAKTARVLVKRYVPYINNVPIGSLPILLGRISAAGPHVRYGGILKGPVAMADLAPVVDVLHELTELEIPFIAQVCHTRTGEMAMPEGWRLDVSPLAGPGAERENAPAGLGSLRFGDATRTLLGGRDAIDSGLLRPIPDVSGQAWYLKGSMLALGRGMVRQFPVMGHVGCSGRAAIALSNLQLNERGLARIGLGLEGLFGADIAHSECWDRALRFVDHLDLQTNSQPSARRELGLVIMAYVSTVLERVGARGR
jgi:hypothetical protein